MLRTSFQTLIIIIWLSPTLGNASKSIRLNFERPTNQFTPIHKKPLFDIPITYNHRVKKWISFYQGRGKHGFQLWLNRSHRYIPKMKAVLKKNGLPTDLAYIAMIESGFSAHAISSAKAVGYWQFMSATGKRYGLKKKWWLDERRDFYKSTKAASNYLSDLYRIFNSWYLTASAYNMGENRLIRLIKKHKTRNYWKLSRKRDFPKETKQYIPKLIAAVIIAKSPKLYGFHKTKPLHLLSYEPYFAPGGTDIFQLAKKIGFTKKHIKALNPSLLHGFIPQKSRGYWIRIPKGHLPNVARYIKRKFYN